MIRTLQKKFIVTSMTAITVLLLLLLGAINAANIVIVGNEMEATLKIISDNEGDERNLLPRRDGSPDFLANPPKNDYDIFLSSNFFVVRFDEKGEIVYVDVSRTSTVSEADAKDLASDVYGSHKETGKVGKYRYRMTKARNVGGRMIIFLDTSNEMFSYIRVLLLSGGIGIICWGLMLLFVTLLSKRAIRPIAENMERQKQFVTNAGHEIKTPLAIIQSNTEAMELYNGENKWSKNIKEQTARLSDLMQNLLLLSRMEEADVPVEVSRFCFSELLEEVLQGFLQPMEMKGIYLQKEIQPNVFLQADRKHMEQLILILLDNAVKYTLSDAERPLARGAFDAGCPEGYTLPDAERPLARGAFDAGCPEGYTLSDAERPSAPPENARPDARIWICLQETGSGIRLQVQNTCESLPQVSPEKLFDRFYRADEARTQKGGGYGIGLSVAKSLVKVNGGKIHAKYLRESKEIAFVVELRDVV